MNGNKETKDYRTPKINSALLLATTTGCGKPENEENERREAKERGEPTARVERSEARATEGLVILSEAAIVASQLETIDVRAGSALVTTRFPGNIAFNQNATAVVQPLLEGRLRQWQVNIGQHVRKEDVLALVENPQNLDAPTALKAPLDGEIIERNAALGDWVKPGDRLAVITDLGTMWAVARVRESAFTRATFARTCASRKFGVAIAARIEMIATTTSNSISVNPPRFTNMNTPTFYQP